MLWKHKKSSLSLSYSAYFSWLPVDYAEISYWPIFCFLHTPWSEQKWDFFPLCSLALPRILAPHFSQWGERRMIYLYSIFIGHPQELGGKGFTSMVYRCWCSRVTINLQMTPTWKLQASDRPPELLLFLGFVCRSVKVGDECCSTYLGATGVLPPAFSVVNTALLLAKALPQMAQRSSLPCRSCLFSADHPRNETASLRQFALIQHSARTRRCSSCTGEGWEDEQDIPMTLNPPRDVFAKSHV